MNNRKYLEQKRLEVLEMIKPICKAVGIKDYDYIITDDNERLKLNNTLIGCSCNSLSAIREELIGYIFVTQYANSRWIGCFKNQTLNVIKEYWTGEEK